MKRDKTYWNIYNKIKRKHYGISNKQCAFLTDLVIKKQNKGGLIMATNYEKYKDKLIEAIASCICVERVVFDRTPDCETCMLYENGHCYEKTMNWLLEEYKEPIKLSTEEYAKLTMVDPSCYIARQKDGTSSIYKTKPVKCEEGGFWACSHNGYLNITKNHFHFISWEEDEPRLIEDILDNCEVKGNENC